MILRVVSDLPPEFIGKICKITAFGVELEKEYEQLFGIGNYNYALLLFEYYYCNNNYELSLMFIDEAPITRNGVTWYCMKEVAQC